MINVPFICGPLSETIPWAANNRFSFTADLGVGLYTVGLQADLSGFDWERLYLPMTRFGNAGQRTGPWDFDLDDSNKPLLPTWRIHRDGRYIGLFHLQRPTAEDLDSRHLRGEFGFAVKRPGRVTITAEPYAPFNLRPLAVYLEPNAFDHLQHQPWAARGRAANWAAHIAEVIGWQALREQVLGTPRERCLAVARDAYLSVDGGAAPGGLPVLAFAYHLLGDDKALAAVLKEVDAALAQSAWGNPDPEGYGHNGDMGCGALIKSLTLILNWLPAELGDRYEPLRQRLIRQIDVFLEQQLLMAQYWGGALMQDHGYRSSPCLAFAAICMLGLADEAADWLAFYVPRLLRTCRHLPTDGSIPFSSYHKPQLYLNDMNDFRDAMRYASGADLFADVPAFQQVPEYILACLDPASMSMHTCTTRGDRKPLISGLPFLLNLARTFGSEGAAYLAQLLWQLYRENDFFADRSPPQWRLHEAAPMVILSWHEAVLAATAPRTPALSVFPDGGAIHYRDASRFNVAATCFANAPAFHSLGTDLSGTDLGLSNPSCGNFSVAVAGRGLIQSAESGYRTGTELGNVLLIDGRGQYGDNKYPMGVPMSVWRGQRIQCWSVDDQGRGFARLNLAPAYADELGVLAYTRDFHFAPQQVIVRDTVVTSAPRRFAYRFHTYCRHQLELIAADRCRIAHDTAAIILQVVGRQWTIRQGATEVVWAYGNEHDDEPFQHVEVALAEPSHAVCVEFLIVRERSAQSSDT